MSKSASFLFAVALVASHAIVPATAQERMYMGTTSPQTFDGGSGYLAPHRACREKFGGVWCTSQMIIENGPLPFFSVDPPVDGAWVNPAPVGFSLTDEGGSSAALIWALDFSLVRIGGTFDGTCFRWTSSDTRLSGLVFESRVTTTVQSFSLRSCFDSRPAACCGGSPTLIIAPVTNVITTGKSFEVIGEPPK